MASSSLQLHLFQNIFVKVNSQDRNVCSRKLEDFMSTQSMSSDIIYAAGTLDAMMIDSLV